MLGHSRNLTMYLMEDSRKSLVDPRATDLDFAQSRETGINSNFQINYFN